MKTLILSDLHLGHRGSRAEASLDRLARVCAGFDRVIVGGDALDQFETPEELEPRRPQLECLRRVLQCRAGPPEFVTGNHDPAISDLHYAYLEEPGLLVCHGDYMLDRAAPWVSRDAIQEARFRAAVARLSKPLGFIERATLFRRVQIEVLREFSLGPRRHPGYLYVLKQLLPPTRALVLAHYMWHAPARMAKLAASFPRPVRHAVFGHSHRAGHWRLDGREIYNTGSFMPLSAPYAVVAEDDRVRYLPLAELDGRRAVLPVRASHPCA